MPISTFVAADGSAPMPLYDAAVDIELQDRFTRGMTVCDFRNRDLARQCVQLVMSGRADEALGLILGRSATFFA